MTAELKPSIIVVGVGGAGGNAVDNMIEANLQGVEFYVANTDAQAMYRSKTQNRLQLGLETTAGLGAGARPDVGAAAAEESMDDINALLDGVNMVFVAAGMGGGTGTGAAPIIAKAAHDRGILTIGVVTKPFSFEGAHRMKTAEDGLEAMRAAVDTLIVVPNQNLFRIANERTTFAEAFRMADDVLYCGVRGITDLMIMPGLINLDFADVRTIMKSMGAAMMGMGEGEGEDRALEAARAAIENPLLDDTSMKGAKGVLINITGGYDMTLFELDEAANEIRREIDADANIIIGSTFDSELDGRIRVSVVAAGLPEIATEDSVVTPQPASAAAPPEATPLIVTGTPQHRDLAEADPRPDFKGRPLPEPHVPARDGQDQIRTDAIFGGSRAPVARPAGAETASPAGFPALFGWRREEPESDNDTAATDTGAASAAAAPKPADFDDSDLEIPAFLRRSANS